MDIKSLSKLKAELQEKLLAKLQTMVNELKVQVEIANDFQNILVVLGKETKKEDNVIVSSNRLMYSLLSPDNIVFQGINRTYIYKDGTLVGTTADAGQVDLITLYQLKQAVYQFCEENNLISDEHVGVGESKEEEPAL